MTKDRIVVAFIALLVYSVNADSPWDCNFDTDFCAYTQLADDDFDWSRSNVATQPDTGPEADHTVGVPGGSGYFAYIDSSHPQMKGDVANLISPEAGFTGKACLSFWYLMWGTYADTLSVYLKQPQGAVYTLWIHERSLDREWYQASINLNLLHTGDKIYFQATVGGSTSDAAIDDVQVVMGECPPSEEAGKFCDYEDSQACGYMQDKTDDFNWIQNVGGTSSSNTGPTFDHTYGTNYGRYMYIETSAPQTEGEIARIISPNQRAIPETSGANDYCLSFYYHMYGTDTGRLNVYYLNGGNVTGLTDYSDKMELLWTKEGNQGNNWYIAEMNVYGRDVYQLVFEGVVGAGSQGDIAIDDIMTDRGRCDTYGDCKFEHGSCYYHNEETTTDDFNWQILHGYDAKELGVGPTADVDSGEESGKFMFAYMAPPLVSGNTAILRIDRITPEDIDGFDGCFSFWYHMSGVNTGTLSVTVALDDANDPDDDAVTMLVWELTGDQGTEWKQGQVEISSPVEFSMIFKATVGATTSAIAIDQVVLEPTKGSCGLMPAEAKPAVDPSAPTDDPGNSANSILSGFAHLLLLVVSLLSMMMLS